MTRAPEVATAPAVDAPLRRSQLGVLLLLLVAIAYLRAPSVLLGGRIWGEEGAFLAMALQRPLAQALRWRAEALGYYVLPLNLCAALAAQLPLLLAPLVFSAGGALALASPVACAALDPEWRTPRRLAPIALAVLLAAPGAEVWLNVASAQFPIAVATAVLLATSPGSASARGLRLALLAAAGLSGVASLLLTPLFALRALLERSRSRAAQAAVLGLCAVLQLSLLASAPAATERHQLGSVAVLAGIATSRQLLQLALYPLDLFGGFGRVALATRVLRAVHVPGPLALLVIALAAAFYALFIDFARRGAARASAWWIASSLFLLMGSLAATREPTESLIHPMYSSRYFYAPNALLLFALAEGVRSARGAGARRFGAAALAWFAFCGSLDWLRSEDFFFGHCDWYAQVRAWQRDPSRPLEHAPVGWKITLPPVSPAAGRSPAGSGS